MVIKVLEYAAGLIKKKPIVVLPSMLSLIPIAMSYLLFAAAAKEFSAYDMSMLRTLLLNIPMLLKAVVPYLLALLAIFIVSVVIGIFVKAVYPTIVQQSFTKKALLLSSAFSAARKRFLPLLWTYFLLIVLAIAAMLPVIFLMALGIPGIILGIFGIFALIVVIIMAVWVLDAVVIIEKISGIEALKRSFDISKRFFWEAMGLLILLAIISFVISLSFSSVPEIGYILQIIASLLVSSASEICQSTFYFIHEKKAKPNL